MRRFVLLALLAAPGWLAFQGAADVPGIYGYVLAPSGIPAPGGTVVYVSFATSASTSIDRSGRFRIPVDRAGDYRVTLSVPGFAPYLFRVTVPASRTLRLPVMLLEPATYFRARFVSSIGEPIASPTIRRRSFDGSGVPIVDAPDASAIEIDSDGATRIGPLPHGITALAVDTPAFAQTHVRNFSVTGADALRDGGTIVIQPGSTLHVDVPRAFVTWTVAGGGRAEATTTVVGEALLEGVGTSPGMLTVTAPGFQPAEQLVPEPPGIPHEVALVPLPDASLAVRVATASGNALQDAVVEMAPESPLTAPHIAATDAKGVVRFANAPAGTLRVTAIANGYAASTMRPQDNRAGAVLTLSLGYRALVSVDLPAAQGPLLVRVLDRAGRPMDTLLDGASDRGIEPPGRLSLGPLPPGDYAIELRGAREQRQGWITIVDRDVVASFR